MIEGVITWDLREFVARDWSATRKSKDMFWAERIARLGPIEGLRAADELRRQVLQQYPNWPGAQERRQDLRSRARLSELLERASRPGGR
jgi:hypothetical protein